MPLAFLSSSIQDIFRQEASLEYNVSGTCTESFSKYFLIMLFAACAFVVPLILVIPYIFPFFFGNQWTEAGHKIQPMILRISVRFVSSPLSYVWIIRGYQGLNLLWQLGLLVITICSFPATNLLVKDASLDDVLWAYSAATALWYLVCIYFSWRFANKN